MTEQTKIILKGRKVIGGIARGEALVSKMPLMGWGNVKAQQGFTVERNHPLYEVPFKGKVLVFTEPRGSGGFVGYGHSRNFDTNPAAFLYRKGNNLTVFAAMVMNVPTVTDFDQDPTEVIETGDMVIVNGDEGIVEVIKKQKGDK
ncbi:aconitase X swivel domain-containing protein [Chloroflexota bacterium]